MKPTLLVASVAVAALAAGAASAHHHRYHHARSHHVRSLAYAAPAQPVPYAEVDHYLRATPGERRSMEAANTGTSADTAAMAPAYPAPPENAGPPPRPVRRHSTPLSPVFPGAGAAGGSSAFDAPQGHAQPR